jgi:hypothetical protein
MLGGIWPGGPSDASAMRGLAKAGGMGAVVLTIALAAAAPASAHVVLGGSGLRGASIVGQGTCKYGVFGPRGVLQVGIPSPAVSGANTRRGTRRERSYVRYRVFLTDASNNFATLQTSGWSGWLRLRQSTASGWSTPTFFDMDWRGNYGADVRIEWWSSRRMIGWRAHRLTSFGFYNQYDVGPMGPLASCFKYTDTGL